MSDVKYISRTKIDKLHKHGMWIVSSVSLNDHTLHNHPHPTHSQGRDASTSTLYFIQKTFAATIHENNVFSSNNFFLMVDLHVLYIASTGVKLTVIYGALVCVTFTHTME